VLSLPTWACADLPNLPNLPGRISDPTTLRTLALLAQLGYFLNKLVEDNGTGLSGAKEVNNMRIELVLMEKALTDLQSQWAMLTSSRSARRQDIHGTIMQQLADTAQIQQLLYGTRHKLEVWAAAASAELPMVQGDLLRRAMPTTLMHPENYITVRYNGQTGQGRASSKQVTAMGARSKPTMGTVAGHNSAVAGSAERMPASGITNPGVLL
jgi:hypothetical protein